MLSAILQVYTLFFPRVSFFIHNSQAAKVVVAPWLGRHHVYGIFLLPNGCYPEQLIVLGFEYLGDLYLEAQLAVTLQDISTLSIPPGYYPIKVFLRTRYAICLILLGCLGKLKACENWTVFYSQPDHYISHRLAWLVKHHGRPTHVALRQKDLYQYSRSFWQINSLWQVPVPYMVWLIIDWRDAEADIPEVHQEKVTEVLFWEIKSFDELKRVERIADANALADGMGTRWLRGILKVEVSLANLKYLGLQVQKHLPGKSIRFTVKAGDREVTVKNLRAVDLGVTLNKLVTAIKVLVTT